MSNQADQTQNTSYIGRPIGARVFIISMQKAYTVSSATIWGVVLRGTAPDNVQLYAYVVYDHTESIAPTVYEIQPEDVFDDKWEALHELEVRLRERRDDHETRIEQLDRVIDNLEDQQELHTRKSSIRDTVYGMPPICLNCVNNSDTIVCHADHDRSNPVLQTHLAHCKDWKSEDDQGIDIGEFR